MSSMEVVESTPICVWCGAAVRWVSDPGCWVHEVSARSGGLWCRGSILRVATPTEWVEAEDPYGWWNAGYMTAEEARRVGGW